MTSPSTISINSHEGYRAGLQNLRTLQSEADKLISDGTKLTDALNAAASAGVVPGASTAAATAADGKTVAPVAAETLSAVGTAVKAATDAARAASQSLSAVITDLGALQDGITGSDNRGETGIQKA